MVAFALVMVFLCFWGISEIAQAELNESNVFYNDNQRSLQFTFSNEAGDATIELIAPDGRIITMNDNGNDVGVMTTNYGYIVVIKDAITGQWKVRYDKGSNEGIDVSVDEYLEPLWITELNVISIEEGVLSYEFLVEYEEDSYYDYTLSITTDNQGGDGKVVETGYGVANSKQLGTIDLSEINSFDSYYLKLHASYTRNDNEDFDMAYSSKFSYSNPSQPMEVTDYNLEVLRDQGVVKVNWEDAIHYSVSEVYLRAMVDGEEVSSALYASNEITSAMVSFKESDKEIVIGLSTRDWTGLSTPLNEKKILLDDTSKFYLIPDRDGIIATAEWGFHYYHGQQQAVQITINENVIDSTLEGEGYQSISLRDEINDITIAYEDEQGIRYLYTKTVSVDTQPPILMILEEIDGSITANEAVILTGRTEVGAKVAVNGNTVVVDENGTFIHSHSLVEGVNDITITAEDELGNGAVYLAKVVRSDDVVAAMGSNIGKENGFFGFLKKHILWCGMITSIVFMGLVIIMEILLRKRAKAKGKIRQSSVSRICFVNGMIQAILGIALLVWYIVRRLAQSSEKFIRLAGESIEEAYRYLELTKEIGLLTSIISGICVCSWLVFLFCRLGRTIKDRKNGVPCSNCGSIRNPKDKFCGACGSK